MWSHSETHILYIAEKKRPKTESFFQTKSQITMTEDDEDSIKSDKQEKPVKVILFSFGILYSIYLLYLERLAYK